MADSLLRVEHATIGYGRGTTALTNVSLAVPEGHVVSVLGSNGAGKSTLLRGICGTLPMHGGSVRSGRIEFAGRRIDGRSPASIVSAGIRLVPEGRHTFPGMSVEENLLIGGLRGVRGGARRTRLHEMYDLFPILGKRSSQRAILLSGGEQQMLVIARGLMGNPRLLMIDEPSLGLAPSIIDQVADLVSRIAAEGTTILLVEQNASLALRLARSVVVLRHGEVAFAGEAEHLRSSPDLHSIYFGANNAAPGPNASAPGSTAHESAAPASLAAPRATSAAVHPWAP